MAGLKKKRCCDGCKEHKSKSCPAPKSFCSVWGFFKHNDDEVTESDDDDEDSHHSGSSGDDSGGDE